MGGGTEIEHMKPSLTIDCPKLRPADQAPSEEGCITGSHISNGECLIRSCNPAEAEIMTQEVHIGSHITPNMTQDQAPSKEGCIKGNHSSNGECLIRSRNHTEAEMMTQEIVLESHMTSYTKQDQDEMIISEQRTSVIAPSRTPAGPIDDNMTGYKEACQSMTQRSDGSDIIRKPKLLSMTQEKIVAKSSYDKIHYDKVTEFSNYDPEQDFENTAVLQIAKVKPNTKRSKNKPKVADMKKVDNTAILPSPSENQEYSGSGNIPPRPVLKGSLLQKNEDDLEGSEDNHKVNIKTQSQVKVKTTPENDSKKVEHKQQQRVHKMFLVPPKSKDDNTKTEDNPVVGKKRKYKPKPKFNPRTDRKISDMFARCARTPARATTPETARTPDRNPVLREGLDTDKCGQPDKERLQNERIENEGCTLANCDCIQMRLSQPKPVPSVAENHQPRLSPDYHHLDGQLDLAVISAGLTFNNKLGGKQIDQFQD